ncbi:MAG TPA: MogA/MoaB family molybdenum cofactor biosynthesis protein [Candidatus Acidoferrales bacterium]|jgi:molybdopterin adenylyltransferase|nr:MogA/MoaB family molybdenum cofactor biosynthesis protein [Candidatus Acidoferrales bacterium]
MIRVAILTISDTASRGERPDKSGPAVRERCEKLGWDVALEEVLPDERAQISARLAALADLGEVNLILTTGGTGLGPRDTTPEATTEICDKTVPGLAEMMRERGRQSTPRAALSRAVVGVRGATLIVNLPGSPKGSVESLDAIAELLPHAADVIRGARHD